ncbi:MAG: DUF6435 family protein [Pseudomonadales bacterium]|jgi:hypothetical protein
MSLLSFLKPDPARRLKADYKIAVEKAFQAQQNGDIRQFSLLTAKAEALKAEIAEVEAEAAN